MNLSNFLRAAIPSTFLVILALSAVGCADAEEDAPADSEAQLSGIPDVPSTYPTESGWSLHKVGKACGLSSASLDGAVGSMDRTASGVVYTATRDGHVLARASARTDSLFATTTCLAR